MYITKTRLYNFDPLEPHFYIVKLGFTGVCIIFLISAQNIDCGYSLEPPRRGGSNEYPQSMFWVEIWKISDFFLWKFSFFVVKFSVHLNRRVFVIRNTVSDKKDSHEWTNDHIERTGSMIRFCTVALTTDSDFCAWAPDQLISWEFAFLLLVLSPRCLSRVLIATEKLKSYQIYKTMFGNAHCRMPRHFWNMSMLSILTMHNLRVCRQR